VIELHPQTIKSISPILVHYSGEGIDLHNFLYIEHWVMEKPVKHIADEWGVSRPTITRLMDKLGVQRMTRREAQLVIAKNPTDAMLAAQERWLAGGRKWAASPEGKCSRSARISGEKNYAKRPDVRRKISESKMGKKNWMHGRRGDKHPNWKGGSYCYSPEFYQVRDAILERDGGICQLCGSQGIDVHHINYFRDDNDPVNLITLCHRCHMGTNNGTENRARWQDYFTYLRRVRGD